MNVSKALALLHNVEAHGRQKTKRWGKMENQNSTVAISDIKTKNDLIRGNTDKPRAKM